MGFCCGRGVVCTRWVWIGVWGVGGQEGLPRAIFMSGTPADMTGRVARKEAPPISSPRRRTTRRRNRAGVGGVLVDGRSDATTPGPCLGPGRLAPRLQLRQADVGLCFFGFGVCGRPRVGQVGGKWGNMGAHAPTIYAHVSDNEWSRSSRPCGERAGPAVRMRYYAVRTLCHAARTPYCAVRTLNSAVRTLYSVARTQYLLWEHCARLHERFTLCSTNAGPRYKR